MPPFAVHWGNRLEPLAEQLFDRLYAETWKHPLQPRCIVTNSPVMQAWLRHYFVFGWSGRGGRVLANCEFPLLYPFVNDWMDRLLTPDADADTPDTRIPRLHPYAVGSLQWRIYRLLEDGLADGDGFEPVRAYLGASPSPRRRFQLAGRLATTFDDYQVYRCEVLSAWEQGRDPDDWQAALWRRLTAEQPASYAALLRAMRDADPAQLRRRFANTYRQVAVFGTTAMPMAYVSFLQRILGQLADVDVYVLNPSQDNWLQDVSARVVARTRETLLLEDHPLKDDPLLLPEHGHPLLCSLGQALQEYLHVLEDVSGGISNEAFQPIDGTSMLADLQRRLLRRDVDSSDALPADDSLQVHICHSPRREVEVLHDQLLRRLTTDNLQPCQVQVLVTDMATYAPLIDAVFGAGPRGSADTIPYAIDGRPATADSLVLGAFRALLASVTSRFPVRWVLDLLRGEAVLGAFDIAPGERDGIESLVSRSGIRWGLDRDHRTHASGVTMDPEMTWEYGLDRLLLGYALGAEDGRAAPWPLDLAEGATAVALGKLARFIAALKHFHTVLDEARPLNEWQAVLGELVDTFLLSTDTTRGDVARIRRAINDLLPLAAQTGWHGRPVPFDVVSAHLDGALQASFRGDSLTPNAVVFCQLRPMNSRPAAVTAVLGLNDGEFPRSDRRPTFDLMGTHRKRGDRSDRRDDRVAFLEAILNARRCLLLSYVGRTDSGNVSMPPSIVLQELRDYLAQTYGLAALPAPDGGRLLPVESLHHIQAAHPDYFSSERPLFSYSASNLRAARQLAGRMDAEAVADDTLPDAAAAPDVAESIDIDTLVAFFDNPARFYYREVLGANLAPDGPVVSDDEEPFAIDALGRYTLSADILDKLAEHHYVAAALDVPSLAARARADGRAPLGALGEQAVACVVTAIDTWLAAPLTGVPASSGLTVADVLAASDDAPSVPASVRVSPGDDVMLDVRGACRPVSIGSQRFFVQARPARLKPRDSLRAWLRHVFACAALDDPGWTPVIATDTVAVLPPLPAAEARAVLAELAACFVAGHVAPLPFAPATAAAYCRALREADPSTPDPETDALRAAGAEWGYRDSFTRSECDDVWLFHAFGDDGPMAAPRTARFASVATTVCMPLLAAFDAATAVAAAGGEDARS